jgi:hypothetical protein
MNVEQNTGNTARLSPDEAAQRENDRIKWLAEAQAQAQQLVASNNEVAAWLGATPTAESIPPESPLPLNERARLGLLVGETELPLWEILRLEFPTGEYAAWQETIETALSRGLLVSLPETRITQSETCLTGDWLIDRESYRQWRVTQPDLPAGSDIRLWLGATPGPEPAETSLPEKQERPDVIKHAIRAAIAVLSPSGALPRSPELFDYILQNSGKGNKFPDLTVKGKSLLWTADNGSRKEFDIHALTERLRRWKG